MLERKVASAEARHEIARLEAYPDVTLGLNYIQVDDPSVNPTTPDAGQDPWGVTIAVNIPIWYPKYNAAKAEALAHKHRTECKPKCGINGARTFLSASSSRLAPTPSHHGRTRMSCLRKKSKRPPSKWSSQKHFTNTPKDTEARSRQETTAQPQLDQIRTHFT